MAEAEGKNQGARLSQLSAPVTRRGHTGQCSEPQTRICRQRYCSWMLMFVVYAVARCATASTRCKTSRALFHCHTSRMTWGWGSSAHTWCSSSHQPHAAAMHVSLLLHGSAASVLSSCCSCPTWHSDCLCLLNRHIHTGFMHSACTAHICLGLSPSLGPFLSTFLYCCSGF